jgi:hypothetical protein
MINIIMVQNAVEDLYSTITFWYSLDSYKSHNNIQIIDNTIHKLQYEMLVTMTHS